MEKGEHMLLPRLITNDPRSSRFSILIVENEPISRQLLTSALSRKYPDIRLLLAGNGAAGLKMFKDQQPDMVISDYNMPIMTGLQMVSEIRTFDRGAIVAEGPYDDLLVTSAAFRRFVGRTPQRTRAVGEA